MVSSILLSPFSQKGGKGRGEEVGKERKYFGSVGLSQSAKIGKGKQTEKKTICPNFEGNVFSVKVCGK